MDAGLMRTQVAIAIFSTCLFFIIAGCGSSSNSTSTPSTPTASPNPGGSGTGSGGSGGTGGSSPSSPSTAPDNYSAYLLAPVGRNNFILNGGTVKVDTTANDGAGGLQLSLGSSAPPAGAPFTLLFCPYPTNFQNIPGNYQNCAVVVNFNWGSQTSMTVNFTMPKGTWSGAFLLLENGVEFLAGGMSTSTPGTGFQSALLPASSVTGGIGTAAGPDNGSGSMSTNGTTLQIQFTGAMPNDSYNVQMCSLEGTCNSIGTLTSDSSGMISGSLATGNLSLFVGEVVLSDSAGVEFISAFRAQ
jgi:hypothetical protein